MARCLPRWPQAWAACPPQLHCCHRQRRHSAAAAVACGHCHDRCCCCCHLMRAGGACPRLHRHGCSPRCPHFQSDFQGRVGHCQSASCCCCCCCLQGAGGRLLLLQRPGFCRHHGCCLAQHCCHHCRGQGSLRSIAGSPLFGLLQQERLRQQPYTPLAMETSMCWCAAG